VALPRKGVTALWAEKLDKPVIGLPEIVEPSGPGYMPLYCAAQWIATAGGKRSFDPTDVSVWKSAYSDLLARLASEDIKVIGFRQGVPVIISHRAVWTIRSKTRISTLS
jgi:hypothetical protein